MRRGHGSYDQWLRRALLALAGSGGRSPQRDLIIDNRRSGVTGPGGCAERTQRPEMLPEASDSELRIPFQSLKGRGNL